MLPQIQFRESLVEKPGEQKQAWREVPVPSPAKNQRQMTGMDVKRHPLGTRVSLSKLYTTADGFHPDGPTTSNLLCFKLSLLHLQSARAGT